jgi:hypothetical protein
MRTETRMSVAPCVAEMIFGRSAKYSGHSQATMQVKRAIYAGVFSCACGKICSMAHLYRCRKCKSCGDYHDLYGAGPPKRYKPHHFRCPETGGRVSYNPQIAAELVSKRPVGAVLLELHCATRILPRKAGRLDSHESVQVRLAAGIRLTYR